MFGARVHDAYTGLLLGYVTDMRHIPFKKKRKKTPHRICKRVGGCWVAVTVCGHRRGEMDAIKIIAPAYNIC